jgi:hypothetical protein
MWYIFIPAVFFLLLFTFLFKTNKGKGIVGEFIINKFIVFFLNKNEYTLLKNVTLPTVDGTTQIDHIVVSRYGIFVIETKNYQGWIYGKEDDKLWTQKLFKKSYKFQNPIFQNYKHIKTIEENLKININKIFSVSVFMGGATFKNKRIENVVYPFGVIKYIKNKKSTLFSNIEVNRIINDLNNNRLKECRKTDKKHIEYINEIKNKKKNLLKEETVIVEIKKEVEDKEIKLLTTSKIAQKIKLKTDPFILLLIENDYLKSDEKGNQLTDKSVELGAVFKKSKFNSYYLWPENFKI